jgi:hypothetical protein
LKKYDLYYFPLYFEELESAKKMKKRKPHQ